MNQAPSKQSFKTQDPGEPLTAPRFKDALATFVHTDTRSDQAPPLNTLSFFVPQMNCAGCMTKIERYFSELAGLSAVRVNLSRKEVNFTWPAQMGGTSPLTGEGLQIALEKLGYEARPLLPGPARDPHDEQFRHLLWCMAVAGFAAANVMLLSVSVWSGAAGATRDLFHWLSALIALPALAYAGQPFYSSAFRALKSGHVNMDVPISLAVILAAGLSLFETINHGEHAFFDAAISLLFFLLIGRTLDHMMRARAFHGVRQMLSLKTETAFIVGTDGISKPIAVRDIVPGMLVLVRPGETIPVDGVIRSGQSDVDWSLVTGEAQPRTGSPSDVVYCGLLNLSGSLTIETNAVGEDTLLSEIICLMEEAQSARPRYRQLAERAASLYVPLVHSAAALTLAGWLVFGTSWQVALYHAIAVLIITCPCALALAVPVVQVAASAIAQRAGVLMKDGAALEALSTIDTVVFDKTGTLTLAEAQYTQSRIEIDPGHETIFTSDEFLAAISHLAGHSLHPLSVQLTKALPVDAVSSGQLEGVKEQPGSGIQAAWRGGTLKLGKRAWCGAPNTGAFFADEASFVTWASFEDRAGQCSFAAFQFDDRLRSGSLEAVRYFQELGMEVHLFSGDRSEAVRRTAEALQIQHYKAEMQPKDKALAISELEARGRAVFMVGDGMNDGPSLKAATVSLSPAGASDLAKVSAGFVLLTEGLEPLIWLHKLSILSCRLIWQNFSLALLYNMIAVPLAVLGGVTPIIAAFAMSASSLLVMGNGLRLYYLTQSFGGRRPGG